MSPIIISCKDADWRNVLKRSLKEGLPVDLTNLPCDLERQFCEDFAVIYSMRFTRDSENDAGFFRKEKLNL
jgi:hypothetical protein